ncbi:Uncharacterised protein [Streptococcus pneumoniae]|nr:Uncharacterised protein [Streptococcus pneumoniae]
MAGFALSAINGFAAWMSIGDAITTIVLGGGAISLVRNYIRNYGLRRVTSAIAGAAARYVGVRVANRVAGFALSAINGFAAWMSIGNAITTIWANNDVNRRDPNLNALW